MLTASDIARYKSCASKKPLSQGRAEHLVEELNYRAYKCRFCDNWHVAKTPDTKQPKTRGQFRRRRRR